MKTNIKNISEFPLVLRVEDVAKIMDISRVSAYNLVHSEGFPCKKAGRRITIPREAFFFWLNGISSNSIAAALVVESQETAAAAANS